MANLVSSVRNRFEILREAAFGDISGAYSGVGLPFENPIRLMKFVNETDVTVYVSLNGIDNHDVLPGNSFSLYDVCTNKSESAGLLEQPQGDRVYVKARAGLPTVGAFYVVATYASQV